MIWNRVFGMAALAAIGFFGFSPLIVAQPSLAADATIESKVDASKLKSLGWEPRMDWDEGIARTIRWYVEHESWWRKIKSGEFLEYYRQQYEER